ncbi:glycosyltransferase family 2 protein [Flavobacterium hydatis]|uniref:Glycosyl transferase family 2 n=1 Tax=Flavobacterium hydatis TaxID=991 RepID=A0A086A433_FLAHY|nr:glycosyltransferase family 2 protein [Flavobacterium hydatis]KFF11447.1 glycosyl transferase family 2 [Flavobacterium hydatis]OXA93645.1 glycosyl transferase family 2 [Flavobacterium hydatis]
MQLSVIILNYNVRYFLEQCVLSVQEALKDIDSEIIVIDNDSPDDSCEMIRSRFPDIKLIKNTENLGFPKGNNIGVSQAQGDYICILNPDTVVAEDTFTKVLAFAKEQQDLGIIGVNLIDGAGNFLPESKRGVPTPWVAFTKITGLYKYFPKSKYFNRYYAQHLSKNQTGKVEILVGAFMIMKRDLYNEVGGFDEDCFMYSDDIDLSYMVLKKGKNNYYYAETTVIHYKGESTIKDEKYMKRFQNAMNFFYKKHFKVSFLFSLFMKIGIVFFSIVKMMQGKTTVKTTPKEYFFYSMNDNLVEKLSLILQNKVTFCNLKKEKMVNSSLIYIGKGAEVILDNQYISFKKCIDMIKSERHKKITFKILPKSTAFLIGSDSSNDRGKIVKIT